MIQKWQETPHPFALQLIIFFFLVLPLNVAALDPAKAITQYKIRVWNMESGLPSNSIFAVCQTHDGFLWLGTSAGLVRFDGREFQVYDRRNTPQLTSDEIYALYEDARETLWIGTSTGGLTRYRDGEFFNYPVSEYQSLNSIRTIAGDKAGNLWIGSSTGGLTCMSDDKPTLANFTKKEGLPNDQVKFIHKDSRGDLWVVTTGGIVKIIKPGLFQNFISPEISPFYTVCLYEEDNAALWIGTGREGLFRLQDKTFTAYGPQSGMPDRPINCLYRDTAKNLWIGSDGGLSRMKNGQSSTLAVGDGLDSGYICAICEDREGSLWIGTYDGGLHQLRDSKFISYTTAEGLAHDNCECIYAGPSGSLWFGTRAGLSRLTNEQFITLSVKDGLPNDMITGVWEDRSGITWIGTWGGLARLKAGKLTAFTQLNGLCDNRVTCICEDNSGTIWVGTKNGLNRFEGGHLSVTRFTTAEGLVSNFIRFLYADPPGNLWIGTDAGLNIYKDGVITIFNMPFKIEDRNFRCALRDQDGVLWFGTHSGLIRLCSQESYLFTAASGLSENYIGSILEDDAGYLWISGKNGISRLKKKELAACAAGEISQLQPQFFDEQDGLKARGSIGPACQSRDGKLWFPTAIGAAVIDPGHFKENTIPPQVIINQFLVDGVPVTVNIHQPLEQKAVPCFTIGPGVNRLEIGYSGISFINPQEMNYRVKLTGYDADWIEAGNRTTMIYSPIPPGHYRFLVSVCNSDGVWNEAGASFSFYVRPYFYQASWFYIVIGLFGLAAALIAFFITRRRKRGRAGVPSPGIRQLLEEDQLPLPPGFDEDVLNPEDRTFLVRLHDVINKNMANPDFNVEQLGKKLDISRVTLYRRIQILTGEPPTVYLRSCRLQKAAQMLEKNSGSVVEIALEVGFASANYFTKCFKKKFGILPSEMVPGKSES